MSRRTLGPILLTPIAVVLLGAATTAATTAAGSGSAREGGQPWPGMSITTELPANQITVVAGAEPDPECGACV